MATIPETSSKGRTPATFSTFLVRPIADRSPYSHAKRTLHYTTTKAPTSTTRSRTSTSFTSPKMLRPSHPSRDSSNSLPTTPLMPLDFPLPQTPRRTLVTPQSLPNPHVDEGRRLPLQLPNLMPPPLSQTPPLLSSRPRLLRLTTPPPSQRSPPRSASLRRRGILQTLTARVISRPSSTSSKRSSVRS